MLFVRHTISYVFNLLTRLAYVGIQTEAKYKTIGPLLPIATDDDLQEWKDFFRGRGWTEVEIEKARYAMSASAYVKLDAR